MQEVKFGHTLDNTRDLIKQENIVFFYDSFNYLNKSS